MSGRVTGRLSKPRTARRSGVFDRRTFALAERGKQSCGELFLQIDDHVISYNRKSTCTGSRVPVQTKRLRVIHLNSGAAVSKLGAARK